MEEVQQEHTQEVATTTNKTPIIIFIVIVLILLIGGGIYVAKKKTAQPSAETEKAATQQTASPTTAAEQKTMSVTGMSEKQTKEFTVEGGNFFFKPNEIRVKKGTTVKVTFKNVQGFHDFKIDEFQVASKRITEGQEETVTFTPDKTGTFEFYCSVGNHRALGMKGNLIVE